MYFCCLSEKKQEVQSSLLTLKKKNRGEGISLVCFGTLGMEPETS